MFLYSTHTKISIQKWPDLHYGPYFSNIIHWNNFTNIKLYVVIAETLKYELKNISCHFKKPFCFSVQWIHDLHLLVWFFQPPSFSLYINFIFQMHSVRMYKLFKNYLETNNWIRSQCDRKKLDIYRYFRHMTSPEQKEISLVYVSSKE